jgi:hypothetical protein
VALAVLPLVAGLEASVEASRARAVRVRPLATSVADLTISPAIARRKQ